jgi:hypothetical protein
MKKFVFSVAVAGIVAAAAFFFYPVSAQKSYGGARWEYASITGVYQPYTGSDNSVFIMAANICYMQAAGCQNEEVRNEVNFSKFLQDLRLENTGQSRLRAQARAAEGAYAKAFAKLGAEGWELVSPPGLQFDNYYLNSSGTYNIQEGNKERKADIYFKRLRQ